MKKQVILSAIVAVLSSAATIGIWTSITPASAAGSTKSISDITFVDADSETDTIDPGRISYISAACPGGTQVVGGGYIMGGAIGLTVASVVKSYPSQPDADPNRFYVEAVNPPSAAGPVTLEVKAVCERLTLTVSASLP
jgi:hypothetical protein